MTARRFGKAASFPLLAACVFLSTSLFSVRAAPKDLSSTKKITISGLPPHSEPQLVGAVTSASAKVAFRTSAVANAYVEYSPDPALADLLRTEPVTTSPDADLTAHVKLTGLLPETTYYYRIVVNGVPQQISPYPSFRTFPLAGEARDFVFAVISDTDHIEDDNGAPVYEEVEAENPAFVIQIGDFDHSIPLTLQDMRSLHRSVRDPVYPAGADFVTHIADRFAFFHTWDDHDYGTNDSDKTFPGRADALQAFKEYYPLPDDAPNPQAGIWHKFSYAQADFFVLDLRSQRDPNLSPPGPQKSMLDGDLIPNGQKQWLKDSLLASTARWKFILTSVPFNSTAKRIPKDAWSGFGNERNELIDYIHLHEIHGIILVSGDLHSGGGIDDGTNSAFPEINVPHTNMPDGDSGELGTWSEGIISGKDGRAGYALIHVSMNPLDEVLLEAKGREGGARVSYLVTLP
jgi:alkaline phosphatase D